MRCFAVAVLTLVAASSIAFGMDNAPSESKNPPTRTAPQDIKCPKCAHMNRPDAKFCADCGALLKASSCPRCGAETHAGDKFCTNCGLNLATGKPAEQPQETVPAEHQPVYPSLKIGGFGDVDYSTTGRGASRAFSLGQFILHFNSALSPRFNFFSELSLTPRTDAGTGSPAVVGYNPDVERAIIRYDQNDQLKLSLGRYHTPVNWWNTAYHHGLWLQTTIARPEMVRFGGQFIPVHFVGGLLEGSIPANGLNLGYNVGLGNGRGPVASRADDAGNSNNDLAWLANVFIRPDKLYPLQVGGSLYRDKFVLSPSGRTFREWIYSAHIVLQKETPEIIAEYARINHKENGGPNRDSEGYYIQAAYRLPGFGGKLKPYYRYERMIIPLGEPIFTATSGLTGSVFGLRADVSELVALKFEYRDFVRKTLAGTHGLLGQLSFAF